MTLKPEQHCPLLQQEQTDACIKQPSQGDKLAEASEFIWYRDDVRDVEKMIYRKWTRQNVSCVTENLWALR